MARDEVNFSLLSNFKGFLLGLIGGTITFSLLLPRMLNNLNDLFGVGYQLAYILFIAGYFITIFIVIIIWFRTKGLNGFRPMILKDSGNIERPDFLYIAGIFLFSGILFLGLIFTAAWIDIAFIVVIPFLVFSFFVKAYLYRRKMSFKKWNSIDYEFLFFAVLSLLVSGLFILTEISRGTKSSETDTPDHKIILNRYTLYNELYDELQTDLPALHDSILFQNGHAYPSFLLYRLKQQMQKDSLKQVQRDSIKENSLNRYIHNLFGEINNFHDSAKKLFDPERYWDSVYNEMKEKGSDSTFKPKYLVHHLSKIFPISNVSFPEDTALSSTSFRLQVLNELSNFSTLVGKRWEHSMKHSWHQLIQKLQFKGLLWFFLLYFLALTSLYYNSLELKLRFDKKDEEDENEKQKAKAFNEEMQKIAPDELQRRWYFKSLKKIVVGDDNDEKEREKLLQNGFVLKAFILTLIIFIGPFFRHLNKEDIDLQKPFLNFDLGKVTGIDAFKNKEEKMPSHLRDTSTYQINISNSFNQEGNVLQDSNLLKQIKDGMDLLTSDRKKIDSLINYIAEDPDDLKRLRNGN